MSNSYIVLASPISFKYRYNQGIYKKNCAIKGDIHLKLLLIGLILSICLFYFFLIQHRKIKYKSIAHYLEGEYFKASIFKTGKIVGIRNNKQYTIEPIEVGDRSAETHFRTFFSIECKNNGMLLLLKSDFFKNYPDWKNLYKLKEKKEEEDFIGELLNKNYKYNSYGRIDEHEFNEVQKKLLTELFSNQGFDSKKIFKSFKKKFTFPSLIQIERNKIYLDIGGLLLDKKKFEMNIYLLEQLSKKIEEQPIK